MGTSKNSVIYFGIEKEVILQRFSNWIAVSYMIKQKQEAGLFDKEVWLDKLVSINTSLGKLKLLINWEVFLPLFPLLRKTKKKKSGYGDKAYCSTFINQQLDNYDIENKITEKAYKNRPLTEA